MIAKMLKKQDNNQLEALNLLASWVADVLERLREAAARAPSRRACMHLRMQLSHASRGSLIEITKFREAKLRILVDFLSNSAVFGIWVGGFTIGN